MTRACGCDLRAVLAGAIICWAAFDAAAVAQQGAEITEELGSSYRLARRTTSLGSIIETLLFDGRAIVTEILVPAQDAGTAGTTGLVARTPAGDANAPPGGAAALPLGVGPGFGGTLLTADVVDNYLVLHRTRANEPVSHEIFHEGRKVGSVTEVGPLAPRVRSAGRNSFAFESTGDRFVVHLTQPDGTKIQATTESGRFSGQVVERSAALAAPRSGAAAPLQPRPDPSTGRSPEPRRLAQPQEEPAPQIISPASEAGPAQALPLPRAKPAAGAASARSAGQSRAGNLYTGSPELTRVAPVAKRKPAAAVNVQPSIGAATAGAAVSSPGINAPAASSPPAVVVTEPPAAPSAKPVARAPASKLSTAKPKQALRTENARPPTRAARPASPVARSSGSPPPDSSRQ